MPAQASRQSLHLLRAQLSGLLWFDLWQDPSILGWSARLLASVFALLLMVSSQGCSSRKAKALEPLSAPSWRVDLPVPGFAPASVALPLGTNQPRPIVAVLHGAADRAEWQCGSFRGVLGGQVFILCPQGVARPELGQLFGLGNVDDTARELRAALGALKARFGGHVAPSPILLVGYGEGAAHAAELARQEPGFFARVALVAGDPSAFTPSATSIFARGGGKRVLFVCTTAACSDEAGMRARLLTRAGATAKSVQHELGPFLDQRFTDALKGDLAWLIDGDTRFAKLRR
jgi:poly(3-hydroxybutyrate) depolymerase